MADPLDLMAQGEPETGVDLPDGSRLIGLHIRDVEGYPMLGIRLDEIGRPVSFATADAVCHVETPVPLQSNPRRSTEGETE